MDYLSDVSITESSQASNSFLSLSENNSYSDEPLEDCFQEIKLKRLEHPQHFLIAHLNINCIRQKFYEVEHLLSENIVDFLAFSETKIDDTFPDKQFYADFFNMYRKDKSKHSDGLMAYIRSDIPSRQRKDLEPKDSLCLIIEALLNRQKWCFVTLENANHAWKLFTDCLKEVIEHHAPLKTKKVRPYQPPFMNTRLRKELWTRKRLYKKFLTNKNNNTWSDYKKTKKLLCETETVIHKKIFKDKV